MVAPRIDASASPHGVELNGKGLFFTHVRLHISMSCMQGQRLRRGRLTAAQASITRRGSEFSAVTSSNGSKTKDSTFSAS